MRTKGFSERVISAFFELLSCLRGNGLAVVFAYSFI